MTNNPLPGDELPACHPSTETLTLLRQRRSTTAALLAPPGPDERQVEDMLTMAARVPDHRKVVPFRFILFEGAARARFGEVLVEAAKHNDEAAHLPAEVVGGLFERAPLVVAVVSSIQPEHKTPEWEQVLTAGAVCQNLLIAASASGFAAQWLTEWIAYDPQVMKAMELEPHERLAGIVYIGTATESPKERARPELPAILRRW
jgi:nitroreductase